MAAVDQISYVGKGIYDVPEAARLTRVSTSRIRRWLRGYRFQSSGSPHESPPVWPADFPELEGRLALSFADLVEIRFVNAFLNEGVSWPGLRRAAAAARELIGCSHPFSTRQFRTDGRTIFADLPEAGGERALIELTKSQHCFWRVIGPYLRDLEFDGDEPARWWPLGKRRRVVLDPRRSFGQPIASTSGVPTVTLARAVRVNGTVEEVARWYETDIKSVRDAVEFERDLRRKATAA